MEKKFENIKNRLLFIANNAHPPDREGKLRTEIISIEGKAFALFDEIAFEFDDLPKKILSTKNWSSKFSEKYLKEQLKTIVHNTILSENKEDTINELFENFYERLSKYNIEWISVIPLTGIELNYDHFHFGKIKLFNATISKIEELYSTIENIIINAPYSHEEKYKLIKQQNIFLLKYLANKVCAEMHIIAEPIRARERIEEEARRVLDCLKFVIPSLYPENVKINISLYGESWQTHRLTSSIPIEKNSFDLNVDVIGPNTAFAINPQTKKKMEDVGLFILSDILKKSENKMTDFEKTILRSLHWFSNSLDQFEIENQLINLITCIETLLTPRDNNPIGTAIAEGIAILITSGVENRKNVKKRIQKIYRMRSAISHGGKKEIFESDIKELKTISNVLLKKLIKEKDKFKTQKDLLSWIENQKFG